MKHRYVYTRQVARPKIYDDRLAHRLIADAAQVLAVGGVEALSLRPLAAGAGTSTSAVYAMFKDKAGLVAAVVDRARDGFLQAQRASPSTGDLPADLRALGHAYRDWALANPSMYAVMFGGRARPGRCEAAEGAEPAPDDGRSAGSHVTAELMDDETIAVLAGLVQAMLAAGLLQGDLTTITLSIWAAVHGMVSLEITGAWPLRGIAARTLYDEHLAAIARAWQSQAATGSASD